MRDAIVQTRITEFFGIRHPIVCGGLMWLADARYVAAVVNAGGMGFITAWSFRDPEAFRDQVRLAKELTGSTNFGVNISVSRRPGVNEMLKPHVEITREEGVRFVETSGSSPAHLLPLLKEAGIRVMHKVPSVRYAETAQKAAQGLLDILNDVLDFSKIEAGKLAIERVRFDLRETLLDVAELFQGPAQEKGLTLECNLDDDLPRFVIGDPTRLRQILLNLVGNAVKFTTEGRVELNATQRPEGPLLFEVADSGAGVAPQAQERIFEAFGQADDSITRESGGTGLGLAISKQLVEMMGGNLRLDSRIGEGSVFSFELALLAATEAGSESSETEEQTNAMFHGYRLLLAEDNAVMREVAEEMLQLLGIQTVPAPNGLEAVRMLQEQSFDVVLMDCQMPLLDGYSATQRIRALEVNGKRLPIIAMTANAMAGDREKCLEVGMDDYLSKPFSLGQLSSSLSRWIEPRGDDPVNEVNAKRQQTGDAAIAAALDELRKINESDEFVGRIVNRFLDSSKQLLGRLDEAASEPSRSDLASTAHTFKSSAAMMGGTEVAELCRQLEAEASDEASDSASLRELVSQIRDKAQTLQEGLRALHRSAA
ncbi:MAG: ATP-binding protein [Acidobacteriota bacterium]